jgi:hypothetical protein
MADNKKTNLLDSIKSKNVKYVHMQEPIKLFGDGPAIVISTGRKRKKSAHGILRGGLKLISLVLAFSALFYIIFGMLKSPQSAETSPPSDIEADALPENGRDNTSDFSPSIFVSDESGLGVRVDEINTDGYSLLPLMGESQDVMVIIVHSHSSERVSKTQGVSALGEKLCKSLNEAGIKTYHCIEKLDKNGVIGAYENMKTKLKALTKDYPSAICVIDLHNSDTECGITFSVGIDEKNGWQENLTLALAVARQIKGDNGSAVRLLPSSIGQNHGLLSLHVGIGKCDGTEEAAMASLDEVTQAILNVCR